MCSSVQWTVSISHTFSTWRIEVCIYIYRRRSSKPIFTLTEGPQPIVGQYSGEEETKGLGFPSFAKAKTGDQPEEVLVLYCTPSLC